jgi:hypothetical protein
LICVLTDKYIIVVEVTQRDAVLQIYKGVLALAYKMATYLSFKTCSSKFTWICSALKFIITLRLGLPLGRPRRRWEDNMKMDLREIGFGDVDWIH